MSDDDPVRRAIRRNLSMTGPQAAADFRDELLEAGVDPEVAERVWGVSCLTPEMLQAQSEENARQALKIELRERVSPRIFGPADWEPPLWVRFWEWSYRPPIPQVVWYAGGLLTAGLAGAWWAYTLDLAGWRGGAVSGLVGVVAGRVWAWIVPYPHRMLKERRGRQPGGLDRRSR